MNRQDWRVIDAFAFFGADCRDRYAWSAQSPDGNVTVITLWCDEIVVDGHRVTVNYMNSPTLANWQHRRGNKLRIRHLKRIWDGDRSFRVVMVVAADTKAGTRRAKKRWPEQHLTMTLTDFDETTGEFAASGTRRHPA